MAFAIDGRALRGYYVPVKMANPWVQVFASAQSDPELQSRLSIGLLSALEAKHALSGFRQDIHDDYDGLAPDGVLGMPGPSLVWVRFERGALDSAFLSFVLEAVPRQRAASALFLAPLIERESDSELLSALPFETRILTQESLVEVCRQHPGAVWTHVPESRRPALQDGLLQEEDWRSLREKRIEAVRKAYASGDLTLMVGAGVSQSANLPGWRQLLDRLLLEVVKHNATFRTPLFEGADKVVASILRAFSNDSPLIDAGWIREALEGQYSPALHRTLYGDQEHSSPLLDEIVELCRARPDSSVKWVINYNFDDVLERSFRAKHVDFTVIRKEGDSRRRDCLNILHVHGYLPRDGADPAVFTAENEPVLSERRYHDLFEKAYSWSNLAQLDLMRNTTGFIVGCSLSDPNQRRLLEIAFKTGHGVAHYALLQRSSGPGPNGWPHGELQYDDDLTAFVLHAYHVMQEHAFQRLGVNVIWFEKFDELATLVSRCRKG